MTRLYTVNFTRHAFNEMSIADSIDVEYKVQAESMDKALIACLSSCLRSGYKNVQIKSVTVHFDGSW